MLERLTLVFSLTSDHTHFVDGKQSPQTEDHIADGRTVCTELHARPAKSRKARCCPRVMSTDSLPENLGCSKSGGHWQTLWKRARLTTRLLEQPRNFVRSRIKTVKASGLGVKTAQARIPALLHCLPR